MLLLLVEIFRQSLSSVKSYELSKNQSSSPHSANTGSDISHCRSLNSNAKKKNTGNFSEFQNILTTDL